MLRYIITFPLGSTIRPEQMQGIASYLKESVDDPQWRDLVMNEGGKVELAPLARRSPVPVWVRHAQRMLR